MNRYEWNLLNNHQIRRYAEYFTKMEFTMYGFDVYSSEVDDRGIDLILRNGKPEYYDIHVKPTRNLNYISFSKSKFNPRTNLFAAVAIFLEAQPPQLYLIPSMVWRNPNTLFVSYDRVDKKGSSDWGLNLSELNIPFLQPYAFDYVIEGL